MSGRSPRSTASTSSAPCGSRRRKRTLLSRFTLLALAWLAAAPAAAASSAPAETLSEQLLLKPLSDGRVLASFEFRLASTSSSSASFRLLPRALLQPLEHYGVSDLHLALNSGRWRYDTWGSPLTTIPRRTSYHNATRARVTIGEESVASGAELWARFDEPTTSTDVESGRKGDKGETGEQWEGLTSSLAGLFCASLDSLDERHTVQPRWAYRDDARRTTHALLPTEGVCTENLTPFLKLLPCKNAAGLATLLNPLALFSAPFHGLAVHATKTPLGWQLKLTFTAVFAPAVTRDISRRDWSLESLFGRQLESTCPLADSSIVRVLKPRTQTLGEYVVAPLPDWPACSAPGEPQHRGNGFAVLDDEDEVTDGLAKSGLLAFEHDEDREAYTQRLRRRWARYLEQTQGEYIYDLKTALQPARQGGCERAREGGVLDVGMSWPGEGRFVYPTNGSETGLKVDRTLVGVGQTGTRLEVVFTNREPVTERVVWFETLGSFVRPFLHTRTHEVSFLPSHHDIVRSVQDVADPIEQLSWQPHPPSGPVVLESILRIPALAKVTLALDLKKTFVPYSQHPPDAHRGFDLAPAIIIPLAPLPPNLQSKPPNSLTHPNTPHMLAKPSTTQPRIYSLPNLVQLATPDFSFVYTNIIFTSTLIALFFGSALNTLLRTYTDHIL